MKGYRPLPVSAEDTHCLKGKEGLAGRGAGACGGLSLPPGGPLGGSWGRESSLEGLEEGTGSALGEGGRQGLTRERLMVLMVGYPSTGTIEGAESCLLEASCGGSALASKVDEGEGGGFPLQARAGGKTPRFHFHTFTSQGLREGHHAS